MKRLPDHAGRMPDHPRYGNPSDPSEEAGRVGMAAKNLDDWRERTGAQFSGGVTMSVGGKAFDVPIGDREIAQKVTGRALPPAPVAPEIAPPLVPPQLPPPPQSWLARMLNRIKGVFK